MPDKNTDKKVDRLRPCKHFSNRVTGTCVHTKEVTIPPRNSCKNVQLRKVKLRRYSLAVWSLIWKTIHVAAQLEINFLDS